ncbi:MAG: GrdX family protein, partial [Synergistes sp.]|nr:GrdX family protein [Synergistes sp.]
LKSLDYICGSALDVLYAGRDKIHQGCKLLADPLYGNFKPSQQPYRSLLLAKASAPGGVDLKSIELIENAIRIFEQSHKIVLPGELPENIENDFRFLDYTLLEETFHQCSVISDAED